MARGIAFTAFVLAALLAWAPVAGAQAGSTRLLDVPYLAQTEDLCGGAAVAMVLRYWGERQVYAEDFAALVDRSASGIHTDVLAAEAARLGWQSFPIAAGTGASGPWIRGQVDQGRPVVALIEVGPVRYHYVVVVAWTGAQVIVHDPARAPFRVMPLAAFERAWTAAGRWALLLLPGDAPAAAPARSSRAATTDAERSPAAPPTATDTCEPLIQAQVELAGTDLAAADAGLLAATQLCPHHAAAWRELSGVRFRQSRWAEASDLAEHAARLDPEDDQGWNLLATSRFLNDEPDAALGAWNRIGQPPIDLVRVKGLGRTRQPVVVALVDLPPRTVLTAAAHARAARRLAELPSAAATRLSYRPLPGGLAEIEASVVERPAIPRGVALLAGTAARAAVHRELRVEMASPTGSGELVTIAWRWWDARPRLAASLAVPAVSWLPGVTTIEGSWERASYGTAEVSSDERRRAGVRVADWATGALRWSAGLALDRWEEDSHVSAEAALDLRLADDRVSIGADAAAWTPLGSTARFARGRLSTAWRSTRDVGRASWIVAAGFEAASAAAPFDLWPGAGTGPARAPLLRAHPLLDDGVVTGPAFGRRLAHATFEYQHPLLATAGGSLRLAGFADTALAWQRSAKVGRGPVFTDVGAGIRLVLPGNGGTLRVDVARGVRDARVAFSAGWQAPWPARPR